MSGRNFRAKNIIQIATYSFFAYWLKIFLRVRIKKNGGIQIKKPFIVVSNHVSRLDPFLILSVIGWKNFLKANPWRFPLHKYYADSWWLGPLSRLVGCYKIEGKGELEKSLEGTLEVLKSHFSLIFFPEGQVVRKNEKVKTKKGIGYICRKSDVTILPVKIIPKSYNKKKVGRIRGSRVVLGDMFSSRDLTNEFDIEIAHQKIMERVYALK